MEKLRFLAGTCAGGETPVEAGLRRSRSAASSMSVGVGGGEFATVEKDSTTFLNITVEGQEFCKLVPHFSSRNLKK